jgi:hypothetical protein
MKNTFHVGTLLTSAGQKAHTDHRTDPGSFGERAQSRSGRIGSCFSGLRHNIATACQESGATWEFARKGEGKRTDKCTVSEGCPNSFPTRTSRNQEE